MIGRSTLQKLTTPFLLRRLVRSNERIADALERICNHIGADKLGPVTELYPGIEDDGLSYSTDKSSWEQAEYDSRRLPRYSDDPYNVEG